MLRLDAISCRHTGVNVVTVVVAGVHHLDIVFRNLRFLCEFLSQEVLYKSHVAVEEPAYHTERKHVAALQYALVVHAGISKTVLHHLGDRASHHPVAVDTHLCEVILGLELSSLQVFRTEAVGVDDDCGLWLGILILRLQRSSVHSHQHIALVARSIDLAFADMYLESRYTSERTLRGADIRWIVWER